ncbi:hypothetical protein, partial [Mycolicibacterium insubricum]|uniref:hypothetical protein n=1 Tax=Mycolicibacterium insubricum TaxID=444597 RepID=UPI0021F29E05
DQQRRDPRPGAVHRTVHRPVPNDAGRALLRHPVPDPRGLAAFVDLGYGRVVNTVSEAMFGGIAELSSYGSAKARCWA